MGVSGLWEELKLFAKERSLTHLAVSDGFERNQDNRRGYRIGIDISIWFYQACITPGGENPTLRTLFFRLARLLTMPLLPLFVFDGPNRPIIKRGKKRHGNGEDPLTNSAKNLINAFGFEWRVAPGEAEAELSNLNRLGLIDGILSEDVDTFLFGATVVLRARKSDQTRVDVYRYKDLEAQGLTRYGMILVALLSGGDYDGSGVQKCGIKFAMGLARAGFGDSLVEIVRSTSVQDLPEALKPWRASLRSELATNSSKLLPSKKNGNIIPDDFPNIKILKLYVTPIVSEGSEIEWNREPDLAKLAELCEVYFEWGYKDAILSRFRTVLLPGVVTRVLRRAALVEAGGQKQSSVPISIVQPPISRKVLGDILMDVIQNAGSVHEKIRECPTDHALDEDALALLERICDNVPTLRSFLTAERGPSAPTTTLSASGTNLVHSKLSLETIEATTLLSNITRERTHASTDSILEYRIDSHMAPLIPWITSGIRGIRPEILGDASVGAGVGLAPVGMEDEDEEMEDDEAEEKGKSQTRVTKVVPPNHPLKIWVPAAMVQTSLPDLVERWLAQKVKKKASPRKKKDTTPRKKKVDRSENRTTSRSSSISLSQSRPLSNSIASTSTTIRPSSQLASFQEEHEEEPFFSLEKSTSRVPRPFPSLSQTTSALRQINEAEQNTLGSLYPPLSPLASRQRVAALFMEEEEEKQQHKTPPRGKKETMGYVKPKPQGLRVSPVLSRINYEAGTKPKKDVASAARGIWGSDEEEQIAPVFKMTQTKEPKAIATSKTKVKDAQPLKQTKLKPTVVAGFGALSGVGSQHSKALSEAAGKSRVQIDLTLDSD